MIKQQLFGQLSTGQSADQYSLINASGMQVDILTLGGIIRRWLVPTNSGKPVDIVLGFDTLQDYLSDQAYLGAVVGRYANRIKHGKFTLDGEEFQVDVNQAGHCLHGGHDGFNRRVWTVSEVRDTLNPSITLRLVSEKGDQGFPGTLTTTVTYTLSEANNLRIEYRGQSDKTTLFNPTQHSYFNLAGHQCGHIRDHLLQIEASYFTPTDATAIPLGEPAPVKATPFDLRQLTPVTEGLASTHEQIRIGNGFDHNWCLDGYQPAAQQAFYGAPGTARCAVAQLV